MAVEAFSKAKSNVRKAIEKLKAEIVGFKKDDQY